jgi:cytochrome c-type biogenesis protein CcmH/NrfG
MSERDLDERIGEAWKAHYDGNQQAAIEQFKAIVSEAPENIDANWGLALSYRNAGDRAQAVEVFKKVRDLLTVKLDAKPDDYERFFMLRRMVTQQIEQMGEFIL